MAHEDDSDDADPVTDRPTFDPSDWQSSLIDESLAPRGLPVSNSPELNRIINLPRRLPVKPDTPTAEALIELAQRKYSLGPRACRCRELDKDRPCLQRLLWLQAWSLYEISTVGGLIASVPCGAGKTNIGLLAPLAMRGCRLALLLIPSSLTQQIVDDYQMLAEHFRVPGIVVHLSSTKTWRREPSRAPNGDVEPTLHVLPYSRLSSIKSSDWIERIEPDLIIADESDSLKSMASARTMRLMRYFEGHPNTRFCGWTGSMMNNSISEAAHLSALALRLGSPMPVIRHVIDEWSQALDAVPNPCPPGQLIRFLEPGEGLDQVRRAFGRRLAETPGFIVVGGRHIVKTSAGTEVEVAIDARPAPPIPPIVQEALRRARDFCRPDTLANDADDGTLDEIITDKLEQAQCVRQIASGMFYRWKFLPINGVPQRRDVVREWYAARKEWNSELRRKMLRGEVQLDSPGLCEAAARRAWGDLPKVRDLPEWKAESWPRWRDVEHTAVPTPQAVRLHSFLVDDVAKWAVERPGIVWYAMAEFAEWVRERARELYGADLTVYGEGSGATILSEDGSRSCIASIKSHGRGRNKLQYRYHRQLLAQSPASARMWQQVLARLYRQGTLWDHVQTELYMHTPELEDSFNQALRCGEFVQVVTEEVQTLLDGWSG